MTLSASLFFDLDPFAHRALFADGENVWEALRRLPDYLAKCFENDWPLQGVTGLVTEPLVILGGALVLDGAVSLAVTGKKNQLVVEVDGKAHKDAAVIMPGAYLFDDRVIIGPGTVVEPGALIKGPCVIGAHTEVRQGAYIRGDVVVGDRCVVGHTTELKSAILLDDAKAGHFAYIGDSILGNNVNLGAGTKCANLKMVGGNVTVRSAGERIDTGLRKIGAILGDHTETGCNSVTSPGTLMGKKSGVYPCVNVPSGYYADGTVVASTAEALAIRRGQRP